MGFAWNAHGASETSTRELTLEEAFSVAIHLQKNRQFAEAGEVYRCVLETAPDHPRALHYAGVLAHQQGRNDEALALIERSLELAPDQADWCSNLGIVLQSDNRLGPAIASYRRAIAIDPDHANAHNNLGVLLRVTGQPTEAEAAYREAVRLDPEHIDAYTNLGILLNGLQRTEEGAACYCKVITLRPKHREARKLLALAHCMLGEIAKAVTIFEEWLEEEPEDPIARHMLAACTGRDVPGRASDGFVAATFDSFDRASKRSSRRWSIARPRWSRPCWRMPALSVRIVSTCWTRDAAPGSAARFAPFARRLTGVDLSAGMLAHARDKHVYHALVKAELTEYLRGNSEAFDLIVSADALVYFGDLHDAIAAFAGALRPNWLLVFTLERAAGAGDGYRLEVHGRYSHGRAYVERLLASAGLRPSIIQAELRLEAGAAVPGLVIRAAKPA